MLRLNKHHSNSAMVLYNLIKTELSFNKYKIKNTHNCTHMFLKNTNIYKNNCLTFNNNINANFKNNIEIAKRYMCYGQKLLPINMLEIDEEFWVDSDFYFSYKHNYQLWNEVYLSTNLVRCTDIKKIISLLNIMPALKEQKIISTATYNNHEELQANDMNLLYLGLDIRYIAFGEFTNGNTFTMDYNYNTNVEYIGSNIIIAPNWESLIDNINEEYLTLFIDGMHIDSLNQIKELQQRESKYNNSDNLKLLLKESLC